MSVSTDPADVMHLGLTSPTRFGHGRASAAEFGGERRTASSVPELPIGATRRPRNTPPGGRTSGALQPAQGGAGSAAGCYRRAREGESTRTIRAEHWVSPERAAGGPDCWLVVGFYDHEAGADAERVATKPFQADGQTPGERAAGRAGPGISRLPRTDPRPKPRAVRSPCDGLRRRWSHGWHDARQPPTVAGLGLSQTPRVVGTRSYVPLECPRA